MTVLGPKFLWGTKIANVFTFIRRRPRQCGNQSTTSESDSETEKDEAQFEKRKQKSMSRARSRCLPMNLQMEDVQKGLYYFNKDYKPF